MHGRNPRGSKWSRASWAVALVATLLLALLTVRAYGDAEDALTIVAGTAGPGYSGDGGPASTAELSFPKAVAFDSLGNLYVADSGNHRVRKVDPEGRITTVAGSGVLGYSGDASAAVAARISVPLGVAADAAGNLYIADTLNERVRKVHPDGRITTVAGSGVQGFGGDGGPASAARLSFPAAVAADEAGNLYIADSGNHRVRRVDPDGRITTVAGSGLQGFGGDGGPAVAARLNSPRGVSTDAAGNLYIADTFNERVRKVDPHGRITTIAGSGARGYGGDDGLAINAQLSLPKAVAVDRAGSLYIADYGNSRVRRVDPEGRITSIPERFSRPDGLALDPAGNLYVVVESDFRVYRLTPQLQPESSAPRRVAAASTRGKRANHGVRREIEAHWSSVPPRLVARNSGRIATIETVAGIRPADKGTAKDAWLSGPRGVAVHSDGSLYIADSDNHRVLMVTAADTFTTVAGTGVRGSDGDDGPASAAQLNIPTSVAVHSDGSLYIADSANHRVRKVDPNGTISTVAGIGGRGYNRADTTATTAQLSQPTGVAVDSDGILYIADRDNHLVRKVDPSSDTISTVAGTGNSGYNGEKEDATTAQLSSPSGVALSEDGTLYIAETGSNRIRKIEKSGKISTEWVGILSGHLLNQPTGVAVYKDTLYIADSGNHLVQKVGGSRTIDRVAGTKTPGYEGDDGPAISAQLSRPSGVALSSDGTLYIADSDNHLVRKVDPGNDYISRVAGTWSPVSEVKKRSATHTRLDQPTGVAVGSNGTLYIADSENHVVRMVSGDMITTVAGTGDSGYDGDEGLAIAARLFSPTSVAVDSNDNLYVADYYNHVVRMVSGDMITTVAGTGGRPGLGGDNGGATDAQLYFPYGVALDSNDTLYIADQFSNRVRMVKDGIITTVAGTGDPGYNGDGRDATDAQLYNPSGLAVDSNDTLYIADQFNERVRMVKDGIITTVAGTGDPGYKGDDGDATAAQLYRPVGVALDSDGSLFIAEKYGDIVRKVTFQASQSTQPLVSDDHGNDRNAATSLNLPSQVNAMIGAAGDEDWFKLDLTNAPGPTDLEIYTTGGLDTVGELRDDGGYLVWDDDDSGSERNFRIEFRVRPQVYYLRVRAYGADTGSYELRSAGTRVVQ